MGNSRLARRWIHDRGLRGPCCGLCGGCWCALCWYFTHRATSSPGAAPNHLGAAVHQSRRAQEALWASCPTSASTVYIILVAMVIVLPLGVGAAIYLTEYACQPPGGRASSSLPPRPSPASPPSSTRLAGMMVFLQLMGLKAGILAVRP
ncbi:MAG: hypothetical protein ACLUJG_08650 [Lawsonibacter sp.]